MYKVFIDGKEGTTGLRIFERIQKRDDIELLTISDELRKDPVEKAKMINQSDVTFLCLPDKAAIESCDLVINPNTIIIDASTAHRVDETFAYGFPELGSEFLLNVKTKNRISVPGCHASGSIAVIRPLVDSGIIKSDYPLSIISLTGYSGGGKKMIAEYEPIVDNDLLAPRIYGLTQTHKHLKEITKYSLLKVEPIFNPIVAPYYNGMLVSVGFHSELSLEEIYAIYRRYYRNDTIVRVMPLDSDIKMMTANKLSNKDYMEIYVFGSNGRYTAMARFDNLGKGASGAAIECMNVALGLKKETGLEL